MQTRVFSVPVNYRDEKGKWRAIDSDFGAADLDDYVRPQSAAGEIGVPDSLGEPLRLGFHDRTLKVTPVGAAETADRVVEGDTATFSDAYEHVDAAYEAKPTGIRELLTLENASAPAEYRYDVAGEADLEASADATGAIAFTDPAGLQRFKIAAPLAWDDAQEPAFSSHLVLSVVTKAPGHWTVTMRPDASWLSDPARVFPVTIDPDFYWIDSTTQRFHGATQDCYIINSSATTSSCSFTAMALGYVSRAARPLLRFDIAAAAIPSTATITNAQLAMFMPGTATHAAISSRVRTVTSEWDSNVVWANRKNGTPWTLPGGDVSTAASLTGTPNPSVGNAGYWYYWNVPNAAVQGWVNGTLPNYGIQVQADVEAASTGQYFFNSTENDQATWPALDVTWTPAPTTPPSNFGPLGRNKDDTFVKAGSQPVLSLDDSASLAGDVADEGIGDVNVNVVSGNLLVRAEDERDDAPTYTRYYNSMANGGDDFGPGWRSAEGGMIRIDGLSSGDVRFTGPTGTAITFVHNTDGTFSAPVSFSGTLTVDGSGLYTVTDEDTGEFYEFSALGTHVSRIGGRLGQPTALNYDTTGSKVASMTDAVNHVSTFTRGSNGVGSIVSPKGKTYAYTYSASGQLASFVSPNGDTTTYSYDSASRLVGIIQPNTNQYSFTYTDATSRKVATVTFLVPDYPARTVTFTYGATQTTVSTGSRSWVHYHDGTRETGSGDATGAPSVALSGSLWVARGASVSSTQTYALTVNASPLGTSKLQNVDVKVDGDPIQQVVRDCASDPCSSLSRTFTVSGADLGPGTARIEVVAATSQGLVTSVPFYVRGPGVSTVASDPAPPARTTAERLADASSFRGTFGLDASTATLASVDNSPAAQPAKFTWGVPLTPSESAELDSRVQLDADFDVITNMAQPAMNSTFAGAYVDQTYPGGRIYAGFTSNAAANLSTLKAGSAQPTKVYSFGAQYTYQQLKAKADSVDGSIALHESYVADVQTYDIDIKANRVRIDVDPLTASTQATLEQHFGPMIEVVQADSVDPAGNYTRSLFTHDKRAGQRIQGNYGSQCTLGYAALGDPKWVVVTGDNNIISIVADLVKVDMPMSVSLASYWKHYYATAAHCAYRTQTQSLSEDDWFQGGRLFGRQDSQFGPNWFRGNPTSRSFSDSMLIRPLKKRMWHTRLTLGNYDYRLVDAIRAYQGNHLGQALCQSGASTAYLDDDLPRCGVVERLAPNLQYAPRKGAAGPQVFLKEVVRMSAACTDGDSGGPVFSPAADGTDAMVAEGLMEASTKRSCYFAQMEAVQQQFAEDRGINQFHFAGRAKTFKASLGPANPLFPWGNWIPTVLGRAFNSVSATCPPEPDWNFTYRDDHGICHGGNSS